MHIISSSNWGGLKTKPGVATFIDFIALPRVMDAMRRACRAGRWIVSATACRQPERRRRRRLRRLQQQRWSASNKIRLASSMTEHRNLHPRSAARAARRRDAIADRSPASHVRAYIRLQQPHPNDEAGAPALASAVTSAATATAVAVAESAAAVAAAAAILIHSHSERHRWCIH